MKRTKLEKLFACQRHHQKMYEATMNTMFYSPELAVLIKYERTKYSDILRSRKK